MCSSCNYLAVAAFFPGHIKMGTNTFVKRSGTTNRGPDYEHYVLANICLQLTSDENTENFQISSNDDNLFDFDDIGLEIKQKGKNEVTFFAIQLKYTDKGKKLEASNLTTGEFDIKKCFRSFQKLGSSHPYIDQVVLYTNRRLVIPRNKAIELTGDETFMFEVVESTPLPLFNTNKTGCCYQFRIVRNTLYTPFSKKLHDYENFFKKFFLYVNQANIEQLQGDVLEKMETLFCGDNNICDKYLKFITKWNMIEGTKEKLSKQLLRHVLALYLSSRYIVPWCLGPVSDNMKLLQEAVNMFHLTVFTEDAPQNVACIWGDAEQQLEKVDKIRKKYQLVNDEYECTKLLWLVDKSPLVVSESRAVHKAIELCYDKKFILLTTSRQQQNSEVFQGLSELKNHPTLFKKIVTNFKYLLPGKVAITLENLIQQDPNILDSVTTNELLEMVENPVLIEEDMEVRDIYVTRFLSKPRIDVKYLEEAVDEETLIVISNYKDNGIKTYFTRFNLISVGDYVDRIKSQTTSSVCDNLGMNFGSLLKINVYVSETICSEENFRTICDSNKNMKHCHHLQVVDGKLEWIQSLSDITVLQKYCINDSYIVETEDVDGKVNIVSGDPGTGKTKLMESFKHCANSWTVALSRQDVIDFCEVGKTAEEFMNFVINLRYGKCRGFHKRILKMLIQKEKVVYLWDGVEEMKSTENIEMVLNIINEMSRENSYHWITCRSHLRNKFEKKFNVLARTLRGFSDEDQNFYIKERLESAYPTENVKHISKKIRDNIAFSKYNDVLGIPLQIFMFTDLLIRDKKYKEWLEQKLTVADLYRCFIEETFNICFTEKEGIKLDSRTITETVNIVKRDRLKNYQKLAMKFVFDETTLAKLEINVDDIPEENDNFGFVNKDKFIHQSYAEYFVATYLEEYRKTIHNLKDVIFHEKYTNVRFFFDTLLAKDSRIHIAALCKNVEEVKNCILNKDSGGRNVLQVVCSWGERYPLLEVQTQNGTYVLDDNVAYPINGETKEHLQILAYLLEKCDPNESDCLFKLDSLSYAEKADSLLSIAFVMNSKATDYLRLKDDTFVYNVLYYSVRFGYDRVIDTFENIKYLEAKSIGSLLHLAIQCDQEKCLKILLSKNEYRSKVNITNSYSVTPLRLACIYGRLDLVGLLIESGARVKIEDGIELYRGSLVQKNLISPLHSAALHGHVDVVKLLVEQKDKTCGFDINFPDESGFTPLYYASLNGHTGVIETLILSGADVNRESNEGFTPLHMACLEGHEDSVNCLIEKGALVNFATEDKRTPLHGACIRGHYRIVEKLIESNADVNSECAQSALHCACFEGHREVGELLIKSGAVVNTEDIFGRTPLHVASSKGYVNVVKMLHGYQISIDAQDKEGVTALYFACLKGHKETVDCLIKCGADVNITVNHNKWTPLHLVSAEGLDEIADVLLKVETAEINFGDDPLHLACGEGHLGIAEKLVSSKKIKINAKDNAGFTPLHLASQEGHRNIVDLLIEAGADVHAPSDTGATPLHLASYRGRNSIIKKLVASGADVNKRDHNGWTALHVACCEGYEETVHLLIKLEANILAKDNDGFIPFFRAAFNHHKDIVNVLDSELRKRVGWEGYIMIFFSYIISKINLRVPDLILDSV